MVTPGIDRDDRAIVRAGTCCRAWRSRPARAAGGRRSGNGGLLEEPIRQAQDGFANIAEATGGIGVTEQPTTRSRFIIIEDLDHYDLVGFYPSDLGRTTVPGPASARAAASATTTAARLRRHDPHGDRASGRRPAGARERRGEQLPAVARPAARRPRLIAGQRALRLGASWLSDAATVAVAISDSTAPTKSSPVVPVAHRRSSARRHWCGRIPRPTGRTFVLEPAPIRTSCSSRSTRCAPTRCRRTAGRRRRRTSIASPRGGARFTFAHAHAVVTLPSHTTILSGLLPYEHGMRDNSGFRVKAGTADAGDAAQGRAASRPARSSAGFR